MGLDSLVERLEAACPAGIGLRFRHIATPPTRTTPIFAPPPGRPAERTVREHHLVITSLSPTAQSGLAASETPVFAIEVEVFQTATLTTVFVSKADSTGFLPSDVGGSGKPPVFSAVAETVISWLVDARRRPNVAVLVALFARAQPQYLFPGSSECKNKHVVTGGRLVRWWAHVLDRALGHSTASSSSVGSPAVDGYLIVPAEDGRRFLSGLPKDGSSLNWSVGSPFSKVGPYAQSGPVRSRIPYFPDDPKSRFIDHLDEDLLDEPDRAGEDGPKTVRTDVWPAVTDEPMFWDTIACRQECAAGALTGFLWVVVAAENGGDDSDGGDQQLPPSVSTLTRVEKKPKKAEKYTFGSLRFTPSGHLIPVIPRCQRKLGLFAQADYDSKSHRLTGTHGVKGAPTTSHGNSKLEYIWPPPHPHTLMLNAADYSIAIQSLLNRTDFSTPDLAVSSIKAWIEGLVSRSGRVADEWASDLAGRRRWGMDVRKETNGGVNSSGTGEAVTVLAVRKKKKA